MIRQAKADDAEKLLEYCKKIGGESDNLTFGAEGIGFDVEQEKCFLERTAMTPRNVYYVYVDDKGDIIGSSSLSTPVRERLAHRAELAISVRKPYWGRGIGTQLLAKSIEFAKTNGIEIVTLRVLCDNQRALSLYKKFGFEIVGTLHGISKIGNKYFNCYVMELML